jgi:hypothetical protein
LGFFFVARNRPKRPCVFDPEWKYSLAASRRRGPPN